ncbi:hypothetical protein F0202_15990 [Shigella flexneri]|nr:hypothetical protein [Escherichia coli]EFP9202433.1 hypothetical protein [Shigella flexneri]EHF0598279.1 hypothetical protein [Shigella sonnei]EFD5385728.1 hypothetical protein [Escherichia coli]EFE7822921.1 hypothetical protein [Escherichia coli]
MSGDSGKVFIQEGFAFCFGIRFTEHDVFSGVSVAYSPYANDIFVWYVADTFQTIVTTWASDEHRRYGNSPTTNSNCNSLA